MKPTSSRPTVWGRLSLLRDSRLDISRQGCGRRLCEFQANPDEGFDLTRGEPLQSLLHKLVHGIGDPSVQSHALGCQLQFDDASIVGAALPPKQFLSDQPFSLQGNSARQDVQVLGKFAGSIVTSSDEAKNVERPKRNFLLTADRSEVPVDAPFDVTHHKNDVHSRIAWANVCFSRICAVRFFSRASVHRPSARGAPWFASVASLARMYWRFAMSLACRRGIGAFRRRSRKAIAMRSVMPLASAAAALVASTSWAEGTSKEIMPKGVVIRASDEGLALSLRGGAPLYTLTLDQITENHRSKSGPVLAARCGETCARLWLAIAPPPKFSGTGDWGVRRTGTGVQLTYKGAGLYRFNGKSLDELAEYRIVPPYLTGYSAKVVSVVDGVPRETVYWHRALYQPPPPALRAPGGVQAVWSSDRFILADSAGGVLIVPASSNDCKMPCHEATPLAAPLAAEAIGEWRPKDTEGGRFWTYKGQLVYRSSLATEQKPNRLWRKIVVN